MPMLTTFLIRLPVWPVHWPSRTRLANPAILSRTACTSGTTFLPSTTIEAPIGARRATWSTARFSVTLILSPRNMASIRVPESRLLCEPDEQSQGLVGDAVLRVVEEEAGSLGGQALAARRVVGEERAQMNVMHRPRVRLERLPRRAAGERSGSRIHFCASSQSRNPPRRTSPKTSAANGRPVRRASRCRGIPSALSSPS